MACDVPLSHCSWLTLLQQRPNVRREQKGAGGGCARRRAKDGSGQPAISRRLSTVMTTPCQSETGGPRGPEAGLVAVRGGVSGQQKSHRFPAEARKRPASSRTRESGGFSSLWFAAGADFATASSKRVRTPLQARRWIALRPNEMAGRPQDRAPTLSAAAKPAQVTRPADRLQPKAVRSELCLLG